MAVSHPNATLSGRIEHHVYGRNSAHEDQRRRTLTLIARLDSGGQSRLADQNRLVLDQLDARIAQIRRALSEEDRDAG